MLFFVNFDKALWHIIQWVKTKETYQGPILLSLIDFNSSVDK